MLSSFIHRSDCSGKKRLGGCICQTVNASLNQIDKTPSLIGEYKNATGSEFSPRSKPYRYG